MSVIGGQNTPTTNGLAYIIDFNNNYISGSSTVTPILYLPTASQFTGSVPNLVNGQVQFTGSSVLRSFQTFPGFSATQGNMTLMFSGESKNNNVLFTQDGTVAVVSTTSSIGYGVPAGNLGRNFPNTGFDHVTLRFSSASVDCFINGIPVSASGIFPTVPSTSTFNDFKIGGNYINAWTGSFSGSLGQLMVYNRVLSDDEIYSNYLIQARRYSLPEIPKPYTVDSSVYVYTLAAGITGSSTISALNTFVSGLKTAGLWDKMIAIYPFIGTSPSASRLNLKDVSLNTTQVNYSGSWSTSLSGSYNNNTSSYGILSNIAGTYVHPLINSQSIHLSYLSYDTPVSGGYAAGARIGIQATGGQISYIGDRVVHTFTSSGVFTVQHVPTGATIEALVVAGGGGGGSYAGGGGGGGGLVYTSSKPIIATSYPITVGLGGSGSVGYATPGTNGENSTFDTMVAIGGGAAGILGIPPNIGGSGGGGSAFNQLGASGTVGQGNSGGNSSTNTGGGGGGGAGQVGQNGQITRLGGNGGNGLQYSISGTPTYYAGGGGGGSDLTRVTGSGGLGGGGDGANESGNQNGRPGAANTGGGGGGAWTMNSGPGGSGIVIISYPVSNTQTTIFTTPTFLSASANDTAGTGLTTGGPLGMITVSRTGSTSMALWKNRVPTKSTPRASASINLDFYLNALNANNSPVSSSQNNVSYASVGAGLTDDEVYTYYELVDNLQTGLGRSKSTNPNAFITTWDTRISGTGTVTGTSSIALPLYGTQAITASWGDGTVSLISSSAQVDRTHSYVTPGVYTVSITGTGQGFQFNNGGDRNKLLDVGQWGSISGSTSGVFYGCTNLVGTAADALILQTTSSNQYFRGASKFNGYINNWNISNVTSMGNMFQQATIFNQYIGSWNTSNVTSMGAMFLYAFAFNQDISTKIINQGQPNQYTAWDTSNVTSMNFMFWSDQGGMSFNQNIGNWNVEKVTNMSVMFLGATAFNNSGSNSINNWRPISCSDFSSMFSSATSFNQPIGNWPLSASSVNMSGMFNNADAFNQNIGAWNVEKVTNMSNMFISNGGFNNSGSSDINNWRPISCSNFSGMFESAAAFNQPIGNWPLSASNINMTQMFESANSFNQDIGTWDVSRVTNMARMIRAANFNNGGSPSIGNWNTSNVTSMFGMFWDNNQFKQDIGNWNVGKVTSFFNFITYGGYPYLHSIYDGWINNKLQPRVTASFSTSKYSGSAAEGRALLTRTYNTASITGYSNDGGFMAITCSVNHNVIVGNKIFMSGSSFAGINGVQTVLVAGSPTTLTLNTIYDPTATGGTAITGYGWSITDGGVV
jgi:surface protein